jgi:hypothetical protein
MLNTLMLTTTHGLWWKVEWSEGTWKVYRIVQHLEVAQALAKEKNGVVSPNG